MGTLGKRRAGSSAIGAVVALVVATFFASAPANAQAFNFGRVVIEGNARIEPGTILQYADIRQGQSVSAGDLNGAYQRLVGSGLFENVELVPQGGTLLIRVEERPTINRIAIEGNNRVNDEQILTVIQSQPSRVFSPTTAEEDAQRIVEAYRIEGRLSATVTPQIIERSDNRVDLVFEVTEGRVVENERLSFVGNRAYSDRRLRRVLETTQAGVLRALIRRDVFVAERVELDKRLLTDFYQSRGYVDFRILDVNVEYSRERDATFVTWNIQEGRSFKFGRITASSDIEGLSAEEYLAVNKIKPGKTYTPAAIENTIARMERLALSQGRDFVRVEPRVSRNDAMGTLDVNFIISRGPRVFVERIDIEGNQTTLDRVIRRQFDAVEGDPFNPREIRETAERLRAMGYFSDVQVDSRQGSSEERVVVDVNVDEQPTGSLTFGASYSEDTGAGIAVGFSERNFLGRGQTLLFDLNSGTDNATSRFVFMEPYVLGRDLRFRFSAVYASTDRDHADYDTTVYSIEPSLNFPLNENSRLTLNYRLANEEITDVDKDSSPILRKEEDRLWTSSVGYEYSYDSRRSGLNPTAGILFTFGQDFAGLGGDNKYIRTEASLTGQTLVFNEEVTLRATIEGGALHMIDGDSRVTDRYFLSSRDLRGFEYKGVGPRDRKADNEDVLGGNYYAAVRFESEFPLGLPDEYGITGGAFLDFGSVWSLDNVDGGADGNDGRELVDDDFSLRSTIGFSIFWDTPLGPLRFNFSTPLVKEDYDDSNNFSFAFQTQF